MADYIDFATVRTTRRARIKAEAHLATLIEAGKDIGPAAWGIIDRAVKRAELAVQAERAARGC